MTTKLEWPENIYIVKMMIEGNYRTRIYDLTNAQAEVCRKALMGEWHRADCSLKGTAKSIQCKSESPAKTSWTCSDCCVLPSRLHEGDEHGGSNVSGSWKQLYGAISDIDSFDVWVHNYSHLFSKDTVHNYGHSDSYGMWEAARRVYVPIIEAYEATKAAVTGQEVSVSLEVCAKAIAVALGEDESDCSHFRQEARATLDAAKEQGARFDYVD